MSHKLDSQYLWWIERGQFALAYYDPSVADPDNEFTSPDTAGKEIRLFYTAKDGPFTDGTSIDLTETSGLPSQFHEALVNKAIALGYERRPDMIQMSTFFYGKYMDGVKEGKKFAYREYVGGDRSITPIDF